MYVDEDKKNISKTLSVRETKSQHFSEYIQEFVTDILKEFEITRQVISLVTDNASNMISTIEKLNKDNESEE